MYRAPIRSAPLLIGPTKPCSKWLDSIGTSTKYFSCFWGWRWKTFWNEIFSFSLQLRRGFAAHKISRSCSICRLNCQQRPEEKQFWIFWISGKFSFCPWSLKKMHRFSSVFYCMFFYVGIQKYFYLCSCFISDTVW